MGLTYFPSRGVKCLRWPETTRWVRPIILQVPQLLEDFQIVHQIVQYQGSISLLCLPSGSLWNASWCMHTLHAHPRLMALTKYHPSYIHRALFGLDWVNERYTSARAHLRAERIVHHRFIENSLMRLHQNSLQMRPAAVRVEQFSFTKSKMDSSVSEEVPCSTCGW